MQFAKEHRKSSYFKALYNFKVAIAFKESFYVCPLHQKLKLQNKSDVQNLDFNIWGGGTSTNHKIKLLEKYRVKGAKSDVTLFRSSK